MSETAPPEKIVEMLNIHFTIMADIILKHNGTIDKYIGDALMAVWGTPLPQADDAARTALGDPAPSARTKPSRSRSKGRDALIGSSLRVLSAFIDANAARASGVKAASEPPVNITSASPRRICRTASPIALDAEAHALLMAMLFPFAP